MSKSKIEDAFKFQETYLTICGVWSLDDPTLIKALIHETVFLVIAVGFPVLMSILAVITVMDSKITSDKITAVHIISLHLVYLVKVVTMHFKKKELATLVKITRDPDFQSYPEDLHSYMQQSVRNSKRLRVVFQVRAQR